MFPGPALRPSIFSPKIAPCLDHAKLPSCWNPTVVNLTCKNRTSEFKRPLLDRSSSARHRIAVSAAHTHTHTTQQITTSSSTSAHLAPTRLGRRPHHTFGLICWTGTQRSSRVHRDRDRQAAELPTPQHPTSFLVVEIHPNQPQPNLVVRPYFSFCHVSLSVPPTSILPLSVGAVGHGIHLQGFKACFSLSRHRVLSSTVALPLSGLAVGPTTSTPSPTHPTPPHPMVGSGTAKDGRG